MDDSGLEHYHRAEVALACAEDGDRCDPGDPESLFYLRSAEVHAMLALAAATAGKWNGLDANAFR